jgi:predicted nuclease of predicted toxin-antitoxin system
MASSGLMRLLADENFPRETVEAVRAAGHDVVWVREAFPGMKDKPMLDLAETESRILVTLDKDFWQIARQRREPLQAGGVILLRCHPATEENVTPLTLRTLAAGHEWTGRIAVVTPERILMVISGKPQRL